MIGMRAAVVVLMASLALSACAGGVAAQEVPEGAIETRAAPPTPTVQADRDPPAPSTEETPTDLADERSESEPRDMRAAFLPVGTVVDKQGAVEVAVTLVESEWQDSGKLVFQVVMNTHSVDLSMDLAMLANLQSDNGLSLQAESWSGGGGHHVVGYLDFGIPDQEVIQAMEAAGRWSLTLREIDAPERVFAWYLGAAE